MNYEQYRRSALIRYGILLIVLMSVCFCLHWTEADVSRLLDDDGRRNVIDLLRGFSKPDFSFEFLQRIVELSIESLLIGLLGTCLAILLGSLFAIAAIRIPTFSDPPEKHRWFTGLPAHTLRALTRFLMGFFRSVPEIVWAFLLVRTMGLGPGAAVIAIALTGSGISGKLYAELAEATDRNPSNALQASGAPRLGVILFSIIPQVARQWINYALFRLECNIRTGTILGVVGAGGLGSEIALSIRYFQFDKLATTLLAVLVFVIALEIISAWLRKQPATLSLMIGAVGGIISGITLDIPWASLFSDNLFLTQIQFTALPQSLNWSNFKLIAVTVSMAWVATLCASICAFLLAPLSTRALMVSSYLTDDYRISGTTKFIRTAIFGCARLFLQICRALPELTLALIFIIWVGPGVLAGILAIATHNIGVIGRLFTDVYDDVEPGSTSALQSTGASALAIWFFSVMPQVFPRLLAFSLYRFEVNVRSTAMIGFVGAGGIGDKIHTAISLFQMTELLGLLLIMLFVVTLLDIAGDSLRRFILSR